MITETREFRERFERMEWQQQIGNLASTMARVAASAPIPQRDPLVADLLREAALFIEWSAPKVPRGFLVELAAIQREVLAWRKIWPVETARPLLALEARNRSDRLLQLTGMAGPQVAGPTP